MFGKRDSLVVDFDKHPPGKAPDGREMKVPYHSASYDFRLAPRRSGGMKIGKATVPRTAICTSDEHTRSSFAATTSRRS